MAHATWVAIVALTGCGASPASRAAPRCPDGVTLVASRGDLELLVYPPIYLMWRRRQLGTAGDTDAAVAMAPAVP